MNDLELAAIPQALEAMAGQLAPTQPSHSPQSHHKKRQPPMSPSPPSTPLPSQQDPLCAQPLFALTRGGGGKSLIPLPWVLVEIAATLPPQPPCVLLCGPPHSGVPLSPHCTCLHTSWQQAISCSSYVSSILFKQCSRLCIRRPSVCPCVHSICRLFIV